jgi:UDP-N-acetylmuramyl pentapeptide phosphotransferase/UDP-N-acetylglucosamine-1-phosphate transferase
MIYLTIIIPVFLLTTLFSRYLADPRSRLYVLDHPNQRSLHTTPTPRNGGIAILLGFMLGWLILKLFGGYSIPGGLFFWSGFILIVGVSFWDDRYPLSPGIRLIAQITVAILLMVGGFSLRELAIPGVGIIQLEGAGFIITLLFVVWMMNLYNFMDGMDGFAGGMGSFGFGFLAIFGWVAEAELFGAIALIIAVANLGFLTSNFPPARVFMGDVGSVSMGFLAASLSLWGVRDGIFDFWAVLLIFSPFIVDATLTVIRRGINGKKIWQAHRTHYYQRLVQFGWGHRKTVLVEYLFMLSAGSLAFFLHFSENEHYQAIGIICYCLLILLLAWIIDRKTLPLSKVKTGP